MLILVPVVKFGIWFWCRLHIHRWVRSLQKERVLGSGNVWPQAPYASWLLFWTSVWQKHQSCAGCRKCSDLCDITALFSAKYYKVPVTCVRETPKRINCLHFSPMIILEKKGVIFLLVSYFIYISRVQIRRWDAFLHCKVNWKTRGHKHFENFDQVVWTSISSWRGNETVRGTERNITTCPSRLSCFDWDPFLHLYLTCLFGCV